MLYVISKRLQIINQAWRRPRRADQRMYQESGSLPARLEFTKLEHNRRHDQQV